MGKNLFIPYDIHYKSPSGAVPDGTAIRFLIELPATLQSSWANLIIAKEGFKKNSIPMKCIERTEDGSSWTCEFTPPDSGLWFYEFEAEGEWLPAVIRCGSDGCGTFFYDSPLFLQTVYDKPFTTPSFLKGGVLYQIFPDRFYNSKTPKAGVPKDRILREDWGGMPEYRPDQDGIIHNNDYFGGDLKGITEKLDYLSNLGVTCLYLNPIFEAHSNHRYNTADYRKVDPLLGTNEDFIELCSTAKKRGISILLDGVFSHTGDDSIYFNKNRRYGKDGAFHDLMSPYRSWYQFERNSYKSWWGIDTLPEVNEEDPSYVEFICGKKGVLQKWLSYGASGFRLDVADELPDSFLDNLRKSVKSENPGAMILGEVWEDATTKISHGGRRRFLLGKQLDSVMNYPLRESLLHFVRNGDPGPLAEGIESLLSRYPKPSVDTLMNFLSTHDIERAITALAGPVLPANDRLKQAATKLTKEETKRGQKLLLIAYSILFFLPGVPCIYYGDEIGMQGYRDPFNRRCFDWEAVNGNPLTESLRRLSRIRKELHCTKEGGYRTLLRSHGLFAFQRSGGDRVLVLANSTEEEAGMEVPKEFADSAVYGGTLKDKILTVPPLTSAILVAK